MKLSDDSKLSAHGVGNGTTLSLVILGPCNIHVQAVDGRMHTVVVPSSEPEVRYYEPVNLSAVSCEQTMLQSLVKCRYLEGL